jgi:hypothetical protein
MDGRRRSGKLFQPAARIRAVMEADHLQVGVPRLSQQPGVILTQFWVRGQRPEEQRVLAEKLVLKTLTVAVPKRFTTEDTLHSAKKQLPKDDGQAVIQSDQCGGARPDNITRFAVVAVGGPRAAA